MPRQFLIDGAFLIEGKNIYKYFIYLLKVN